LRGFRAGKSAGNIKKKTQEAQKAEQEEKKSWKTKRPSRGGETNRWDLPGNLTNQARGGGGLSPREGKNPSQETKKRRTIKGDKEGKNHSVHLRKGLKAKKTKRSPSGSLQKKKKKKKENK